MICKNNCDNSSFDISYVGLSIDNIPRNWCDQEFGGSLHCKSNFSLKQISVNLHYPKVTSKLLYINMYHKFEVHAYIYWCTKCVLKKNKLF